MNIFQKDDLISTRWLKCMLNYEEWIQDYIKCRLLFIEKKSYISATVFTFISLLPSPAISRRLVYCLKNEEEYGKI